ncbi:MULTISPECIES: aldo/keto reductase [unclassified Streptomyces]|uniref:aldo/keto reductase n=1 Tax=unclassified Streptomyces TaxID=2593676 RepID=UPI000CD58666|nr:MULTISPECIES: aldo/keto reductase [unclassified Streptomyces]
MPADLALGTHRCRQVAAAARRTALGPAPWVDTAPNYQAGRAHEQLAPVLAAHPSLGLSTKVGVVPVRATAEALDHGVLTVEAARRGYSLAPSYVRWQLERSIAALGRQPDVVFVHNPERAERVGEQLAAAFRVLEEEAEGGRIGGYGVATWSGLDDEAFDVPSLVEMAHAAARRGTHHLVAVQFPLSLVTAGPVTAALDGQGPIAEARAHELEVFASSPLHGGELPGLVTNQLAEFIRPGLSPAGASLLAVASCPGVTRVLLGCSTAAHWDEALAALADGALRPDRLRKVLDVLATA